MRNHQSYQPTTQMLESQRQFEVPSSLWSALKARSDTIESSFGGRGVHLTEIVRSAMYVLLKCPSVVENKWYASLLYFKWEAPGSS
jgi:hypothetical protein